MDEETFKNRTLRFTNNNFVGNGGSKVRDTSNPKIEGWENQDPTKTPAMVVQDGFQGNDQDGYDSIEEDIIISTNSPPVNARTKNKSKSLYPPLPPK
jgi:hypothetical protein